MKNLKVAVVRRKCIDMSSFESPSCTGSLWICYSSYARAFFLAGSQGIFRTDPELKLIYSWPDVVKRDSLLSFNFLSDDIRFCAIFRSGLILLVDSDTFEFEIRCLEVRAISGSSWAPDFHTLVLNSPKGLVTVGWGSKATQFQGSTGRKVLKDAYSKAETPIFEWDKKSVEYSWSGDARFLGVSCVKTETLTRSFFVWSDEGDLLSRLEFVEGAGSPIAFKPTGGLIAITRLLKGSSEIIFFEKNGQERSQLVLSDKTGKADKYVSWLCWNMNCDILAVDLKTLTRTLHRIQFWCRNNYKWQLKYCLPVEEEVLYREWNSEEGMSFQLVTVSGDTLFIDFEFAYDFCDMSVIFFDGKVILVPRTVCFTDLFLAPVPPPMFHYSYQFASFVCEVAQSSFGAVFLLSTHQLLFCRMQRVFLSGSFRMKNKKVFEMTFSGFICFGTFVKEEVGPKLKFEVLIVIRRVDRKLCFDHEYIIDVNTVPKSSVCYDLHYYEDGTFTMVACLSGKTCTYNIIEISLNEPHKCLVVHRSDDPVLCHRRVSEGLLVQTVESGWSAVALSEENSIIGLTKDNVLLWNGQEVCRNVGSYSVDDEFLLLLLLPTGSATCKLYTVEVQKLVETRLSCLLVNGRTVEQGAVIIGHENFGTRVWLEMPRGNLETIHLRSLVLKKLEECFESGEYKDAMRLMRRHRIDMNLMFDRNPE
ncbi:unnamed protein product, partial [Enterobius vermicularis]|uniref:Elongator complex protein 1 n=1 Tax=Enterobius vermicularis TaxID=51028 RepID=A0A0N4VND6_ENTVE